MGRGAIGHEELVEEGDWRLFLAACGTEKTSEDGDQDRSTILAESIKPALRDHLNRAKALHNQDLAEGYGEVYMPGALAVKYPSAGKEWCWQYVFPSRTLSVDRLDGKIRRFHDTDTAIQQAIRNAVRAAGITKPASVHSLRHS